MRNVIERALILENGSEIQPESLPDFHLEARLHKTELTPKPANGQSLDEIMTTFERDLITSILEQHHFNLAKTAKHLKISRHALRYRIQRLNISAGTVDDEEPSAGSGKEAAT